MSADFKSFCLQQLENNAVTFRLECLVMVECFNKYYYPNNLMADQLLEQVPDKKIDKFTGTVTDDDKLWWASIPKPNY